MSTENAILDATAASLCDGVVGPAMDALGVELLKLRSTCSEARWQEICQTARQHAVRTLIHESPFTRRAFEKPRGYAGDAITLDYIYGARALPVETSALGRSLYDQYEFDTASCVNVRARRDVLTSLIDEAAIDRPSPRIASIACGHLREIEASGAVRRAVVDVFYGLDQDTTSLEFVAQQPSHRGVTPVLGSVRRLVTRKIRFDHMDLIYSAGLYDYLAAPTATALTRVLFDMLRPGGRLVIANFTPDLKDVGYLEAFMDWRLTYRTESELRQLAQGLPTSACEVFRGLCPNVAFLQVRRAAHS